MPTKVRCGGHVTLLFTVDKSTRLKRSQGSTGAGFSIQHGVQIEGTLHRRDDHAPPTSAGMTPAVHPKPPPPTESIVHVVDMDGEAVEDTTLYMDFIEACRHATLVRSHEWFELEIILECPTSQGFGMSAAGLLALGMFLHETTNRGTPVQYQKIAHRIEREHGAGLGDVLGMSVGGVELRLSPGAPGWPGHALSFSAESPLLLIWDNVEQRHTATYIDDPDWQRSITQAGEQAVGVLSSYPWTIEQWPELLKQSHRFANASGMLDEPERARVFSAVEEAVTHAELQDSCAVRLCMLGSSVAVLPRHLNEPCDESMLMDLAKRVEMHGFSSLLTKFSPLNHLD